MYRYVVKLPDIFDCQGQIFIFRNFFLSQFLEHCGVKVAAVAVVVPVDEQCIRSVEVCCLLNFMWNFTVSLSITKLYKISTHNQHTFMNVVIKRPFNERIHESVLVVIGDFLYPCYCLSSSVASP